MKTSQAFSAWMVAAIAIPQASADPIIAGLLDPGNQSLFDDENVVPNALDSGFIFKSQGNGNSKNYKIEVKESLHNAFLRDADEQPLPDFPIYGYAAQNKEATWPGMTFEEKKNEDTFVSWFNKLPVDPSGKGFLITDLADDYDVLDKTLHWAYSLQGYTDFTIEEDGVPIVPHLHGGHTQYQYDGNPEFFFSPNFKVKGPQWITKKYRYRNDQPAGTLWYHDHALGMTRLNVYAGMAGFYILRDDDDTGTGDNPLGLPANQGPENQYELALAIQDRSFKDDGTLYYPAHNENFQGDLHPAYKGFIVDEVANLTDPNFFPYPDRDSNINGGPTALAEFFGDFMLVNGKVWPKANVEPRHYRLRLLNGCDSRFLAIWFCVVDSGETDPGCEPDDGLDFTVIGSDQGLGLRKEMNKLLIEPGARYDIIINFSGHDNKRIIMANGGGDGPYGGGASEEPQVLLPIDSDFTPALTDRIMAFDVSASGAHSDEPEYDLFNFYPDPLLNEPDKPDRTRLVGLWEGTDEFGRLQPLQGTVGEATDYKGDPIYWPDDYDDCGNGCVPEECNDCACEACSSCPYYCAGLSGPMEGTAAWHSPTTENPALGDMEEWWIYNFSADAHPIHLHLVHLQVMEREKLKLCDDGDPSPCIELVEQPVVQHMGALGDGYKAVLPVGANWTDEALYEPYTNTTNPDLNWIYEEARKDMVIAYPGTVTKIRAKFDKPGRYVWHCHILSHEDHEMMRVLHVGEGARDPWPSGKKFGNGQGRGRLGADWNEDW